MSPFESDLPVLDGPAGTDESFLDDAASQATPGGSDTDLFIYRPGDEPIPGYSLVEPLGRGGFGEVWKCAAPGGLVKAIKFVHAEDHLQDCPVEQEREALERIKAIRHPFLLTTERIEVVDSTLMIVMELADHNLQELRQEYVDRGLRGIPRDELLRLLAEAAEILDVLNVQHGLQHLDVKPCNLFLVYNHVKVGDFGVVECLDQARRRRQPQDLRGLTPLYVACERLRGAISRHSDQYSLAVVYQDLLTGVPPFQGQTARQVFMRHLSAEPNLDPLPPADRPVVARALAKVPDERFPSCAAFIRALRDVGGTTAAGGETQADAEMISRADTRVIRRPFRAAPAAPAAVVRVDPETGRVAADGQDLPTVQQFIHAALLFGTGPDRAAPCEVPQGPRVASKGLEFRCSVQPSSDVLQQKFRQFCQQWDTEPQFPSQADFACRLKHRQSVWKKWLGEKSGVDIRLDLQPVHDQAFEEAVGREVVIRIRPFGDGARFDEIGPLLLRSLLSHLPTTSDRRTEARAAFPAPMQVYPVAADGRAGEPLEGACRDLSLTGIGFVLPRPLYAEYIYVRFPSLPELQQFAVLARVARVRRVSPDLYELGAALPRGRSW